MLTGETTLEILTQYGVSAEKSCDATCALEAARELEATMFSSGLVTGSEGQHLAFIRLVDSESTGQPGAVQLEETTVRELRQQFAAQSSQLFATVMDARAKASARREIERPRAARSFCFGTSRGRGTHAGSHGRMHT